MSWFVTLFRSIATAIVGVISTLIAAPTVMVIAAVNDTSPWIERVIRSWSRVWLSVSGTELTVVGSENIEAGKSYVVVANHLSTLDIMVCFLAVPLPIRYLAKKELFRIPILAQGMRAVGIVEVDRSARSAIHAQVNSQSKELIEKGRSLIIYPEGTRPRNGALDPFKKGAFTMAIASQLPILPVTIHGTHEAWKPDTLWVHGGKVTAIIDPPIDTVGMTQQDSGQLTGTAYGVIAGRVGEMGGRISV
ncbi:MAG TPA: lysophospholipid acyltransferase family protein [Acidimicrobiia bacterium]